MLETSASESLYSGQFTLPTQLIKPNYLVILLPTRTTVSLVTYPLYLNFRISIMQFFNYVMRKGRLIGQISCELIVIILKPTGGHRFSGHRLLCFPVDRHTHKFFCYLQSSLFDAAGFFQGSQCRALKYTTTLSCLVDTKLTSISTIF